MRRAEPVLTPGGALAPRRPNPPPALPTAPRLQGTAALLPHKRTYSRALVAPPPNWNRLVGGTELEARFLWQGLRPQTRANYEGRVRAFAAFAGSQGWAEPLFPASPRQVSAWIASEAARLGTRGELAPTSLESMVNAISAWHRDLDLQSLPLMTSRLRLVIRGAHRTYGTRALKQALPITLPVLRRILETIRKRPSAFGGRVPALAVSAAFALAFACFLRMGEITYTSFSTRRVLTRNCVTLSDADEPSILRLPTSKTDLLDQGTRLVIPKGPPDVCPIVHLRRWLEASPRQQPDSPLFHLPGGAFQKKRVVELLSRALRESGIDPVGYSGHSFRRGAATWAASIGIPPDQIRRLGRWSSGAANRYAQWSAVQMAAVSQSCLTATASQSVLPPSGIPPTGGVWNPAN